MYQRCASLPCLPRAGLWAQAAPAWRSEHPWKNHLFAVCLFISPLCNNGSPPAAASSGAWIPLLISSRRTTCAAAAWASPCCLFIISVAGAVRDWGPLVLLGARRTLSSSCQGAQRGRRPHPHPGVTWPWQDGFRAADEDHGSLIPTCGCPWLSPSLPWAQVQAGLEAASCSHREGSAKVAGHGTEEGTIQPRQILAARLGREGRMHSRGRKAQQAPAGQGRELLSRAELFSCCSLVFPALRASEAGN